MNVWWISLLSFLAGFAICTAIAGWLVAWQLWRRPALHNNRLKLALYDPGLHELDELEVEGSSFGSIPRVLGTEHADRSCLAIARGEESPANQLLVQHVFEENIALREHLGEHPRQTSG